MITCEPISYDSQEMESWELKQNTGQLHRLDFVSEEKCFFEWASVELRWYLVLYERGD